MRTSIATGMVGITLLVASLTACSSGSKSASPSSAGATSAAPAATSATTAAATTGGTSEATSPTAGASSASPTPPGPSPAGGGSSGTNACSLLSLAQASALVGNTFTAAVPSTIATGQDQCAYAVGDDTQNMVVIVYQSDSGVTFAMMTSVLASVGPTKAVSGVGDKAEIGSIELDAQAGERLVAVEGGFVGAPGGSAAVAVAKAIIAALG